MCLIYVMLQLGRLLSYMAAARDSIFDYLFHKNLMTTEYLIRHHNKLLDPLMHWPEVIYCGLCRP